MTDSQNNGTFRVLAACLLGAAMLAVLPSSVTMPVRDALRVFVSPGQRLVSAGISTAVSRWQQFVSRELVSEKERIVRLKAELAASQYRERRAHLAAVAASEQLAGISQNGATPFEVTPVPSLIRTQAVRADVLGVEMLTELKSRGILNRGASEGVAPDLWVLDAGVPVIQAGSEVSVADGLPVFAGRCIVGRVVEAGRWTSTLQYLTEPGFRARALLVDERDSADVPDKFTLGAEGLIEGRSDLKQQRLCELTQIPVTEQVEVGMAVYSPPDHAVDAPMLFGHVVSAEVPTGGLHWTITVRPAVDLESLRQVEVAVPSLKLDFPIENPDGTPELPSPNQELPITGTEAFPRPKSATGVMELSLREGAALWSSPLRIAGRVGTSLNRDRGGS